ncbi:dienelactone hydrolase family protein [Paenibacillus sp. IHBB 3054]|uniref:carboxylesterase family protein n=1 Tax=Paenibacillus sp. IHBB 3054 TaxID=3425689 RepID=UPI003F67422B
MPQKSFLFEQEVPGSNQHLKLPYLLYLPHLLKQNGEPLPVILFLHGRDQRGDDLELLKIRGIPQLIEQRDDFPFIVISPQCPDHFIWPDIFKEVMAILDEITRTQPVDLSRIYLTGLSMGGYAVWDLAMENPARFAAIAPVCGSGSQEQVHLLRDVPVWAFHGAHDDVVPATDAAETVQALIAAGGIAKLTLYPEGDHDAWSETYNNPELYAWFLAHKLD